MESVSVPVEILCRSELFTYKYFCTTLCIEALEIIVILCSFITFCFFYVDGAIEVCGSFWLYQCLNPL